jgi:hypothetical protein
MDFGKKTHWYGDGSNQKEKLWDAIESAEKVQEDTALEQKHNAYVLKDKYLILRFICYNCHKPHYWGGQQKNVGMIDYSVFCPKINNRMDYRNILLDQKFMDVPMEDALSQ